MLDQAAVDDVVEYARKRAAERPEHVEGYESVIALVHLAQALGPTVPLAVARS